MDNDAKLLESLVDKATEYGKTTLELAKLKALDKTSDVVSSVIPHSIVVGMVASFMLFLNLGIALWLGEIIGKLFYGFFVIAAFYVFTGSVVHLFMHKSLKRYIRNYVIKQLLK